MTRLLAATMEELAASEAKQRAFAAKMELLRNERDRLATEAVQRAWDLLEELRRSVSTELLSASGYDAFQLPRLAQWRSGASPSRSLPAAHGDLVRAQSP